jgi:hypothetical protein
LLADETDPLLDLALRQLTAVASGIIATEHRRSADRGGVTSSRRLGSRKVRDLAIFHWKAREAVGDGVEECRLS